MNKTIMAIIGCLIIFVASLEMVNAEDNRIKFFDMRVKTYDCQFDCEYVIRDGRCLIRATDLIKKLGFNIEWVENTRTIIMTNANTMAMFELDSKYVWVSGVEQDFGFIMDTNLTIIDGHTYMPIRYICEAFDLDVDYSDIDGERKIEINKEK